MRCAGWLKRSLAVLLYIFAASSAHATISATATGSTYMGSSGVTSFTLNRPSVVAAGDLLVVQIALNNGSNSTATTITTPSGWTQQANNIFSPYGGTYLQQVIYSRVATSADTANGSTSWSLSRSATTAASMTAFRSSISGYSPAVGGTTVFLGSGPSVNGVTSQTLSATAGQVIVRFASETLSPNTMQSSSSPTLTTDVTVNSGSWALYVGHRTFIAGNSQTDLIKNVQILSGVYMAHGILLSEAVTPSTLDHFEFTYATQGLTCEAQTITIKACADSSCSSLATSSSTVTLSASSGTLSATTVTFTGSTTVTLRQNAPATVTLSVSSATPSATSSNTCNGTSSCTLQFVDAGLEFNVPTLLANKPSGAVRLRAVKSSGDASNSCVALFQNTSQNIKFWSAYTTPSTGTRSVELRAGSGSGSFTSISGNSGSPTPLSLTFDSNGETTFEARYQDAGLMALNASFSGGASGTYANLSIAGTDNFVSTPAGFCIRAPIPNSSPQTYYTCTANFANCSIIAKTGNAFSLSITAAAWEVDNDSDFCTNNGTTPNYAQSSLALSSTFGLTAAQFNALGTASDGAVGTISNGVITTPATVTIAAGSGGSVTQTNVTESEVGAFTFTVTPPTNTYNGVTVPATTSGIIGRFTPDHFTVMSGSTLTNRSVSCASSPAFTYIGETLNLSYQLNAMNSSNQLTRNYQGTFASLLKFSQQNTLALAPSPLPRSTLNVTSALATPSVPDPVVAAWTNGQTATIASPVYVAKPTGVVGPYTGAAFGVVPQDSDGVTTTGISLSTNINSVSALNLDTTAPTADGTNDHVQIGSTTELRYGRLRLNSASGPSNMDLPIPVYAEYWNGSGFVSDESPTRVGDNCTIINGASATFTPTLGATATSGNNTAVSKGKSYTDLIMLAPGASYYGNVNITLGVSSTPWLEYDWNGDSTLDTTATATATFGTYRGSDRVIYWQETQ